MTNKETPEYLFETSWEICNKIGGIHTVIATKVQSLQQNVGENLIPPAMQMVTLSLKKIARFFPNGSKKPHRTVFALESDDGTSKENPLPFLSILLH